MQIRLLQLAVLLICLSGCIDRHTNTPAFYVWKSKLSAEDADTAYLNTLGVQKIYARMFDVDNKEWGIPYGRLFAFFRQSRLSARGSPRYIYHQPNHPAMSCRRYRKACPQLRRPDRYRLPFAFQQAPK